MPYQSDGSDVPERIKGEKKRRQFAAVWNSSYKRARDDGKGHKDAESSAFAQATSVTSKEDIASDLSKLSHETTPRDNQGQWADLKTAAQARTDSAIHASSHAYEYYAPLGDSTRSDLHSAAVKAHDEAAQAHEKAAERARSEGDLLGALHHDNQALMHASAARSHASAV